MHQNLNDKKLLFHETVKERERECVGKNEREREEDIERVRTR